MRERPWGELHQGRAITVRWVARLLKPFGIASQQVRKGAANKRGYTLCSFEGVFARYLSATTLHPKETAASSDFSSATSNDGVADENGPEAAETLDCSTVADNQAQNGSSEEERHAAGNGADPSPPPPPTKRRRGRIKGADTGETEEWLP
jgi:hypothetical protein